MQVIRALKAAVPVAIKQPIKNLLLGSRRPERTDVRAALDRTDVRAALGRIAARGLAINSVIDVGASDGCWSRMAEEFWPNARFHLIEAFDHWKPALDALVGRRLRYSYSLAAAGPRDGEVFFTNSREEPFGGVAALSPMGGHHWKVPMVTIDGEASRLALAPPFLVKFDTHGFEREIIAGAGETLRNTNLLINEFYNFQSEARRWPQMVALIESLGFRCVDLIDPLWRTDGVLWQIDFAFVRHDRPEFSFEGFTLPG